MKLLRVCHIVFLSFSIQSAFAQENTKATEEYVLPFDSIKTKDKKSYSFSTGVEMGFSGKSSSSFSTFYSPRINYEISPKLEISAGLTYINSSIRNSNNINDINFIPFNGNISQYYTSVSARYRLTDKLRIGGGINYNLTDFNSAQFQQNQNSTQFDRIGYSAFFEYKITENTYLQGEIRFNDTRRIYPGNFFNSIGADFDSHNSFFNSPF